MIRIEKVNIYLVPLAGNSDKRLVIDRGIVTVTRGQGIEDSVIEAFHRDSGKLMMRLLIQYITDKTKNVVCQAGKMSFQKGQTTIELKCPIMVETLTSAVVTFRMDLKDHRIFNEALDSV